MKGGNGRASAPEGADDREQFAAYVAELTGELAALARRHRLDALSYLLEVAQLEARNTAQLPKKLAPL